MVIWLRAAIMRIPSTARSRTRITAKTQSGTILIYTKARKARSTSILSANGSRKAPRSVTAPLWRAQMPSILSVIAAATNTTRAVILAQVSGSKTKIANTTESSIRRIVKQVGPVSPAVPLVGLVGDFEEDIRLPSFGAQLSKREPWRI